MNHKTTYWNYFVFSQSHTEWKCWKVAFKSFNASHSLNWLKISTQKLLRKLSFVQISQLIRFTLFVFCFSMYFCVDCMPAEIVINKIITALYFCDKIFWMKRKLVFELWRCVAQAKQHFNKHFRMNEIEKKLLHFSSGDYGFIKLLKFRPETTKYWSA